MRRVVAAVVMALALCAAGVSRGHERSGTRLPGISAPVAGWRSRAAVEAEAHQGEALNPNPLWSFVMPSAAVTVPAKVEVLGFLPSWNLKKVPVETLRLDRLTTIAFFRAAVNGDGTLGDTSYWGTPMLAPLMDAAKAAGVRVVLTATCFVAADMNTLLNSPTARATAIQNLVDAVVSAGGDGVNVDFEGLPLAVKSPFVLFVRELKEALDEALGVSYVTVDTPAIDWAESYDYDQLALAGDGLVIMGYDYHWQGGNPGPVAPLATVDPASRISLTWTLDDYDTWGGVENRGRFVLGLPLYGWDWPVAADVAGTTATADATSRKYAECGPLAAAAGGWRWDEVSATPWFGVPDGAAWRQTWCENLDSLTAKVALAADRNLGGIAWWALGNEEGSDDPWTALDRAYPPPVEPVPDMASDLGQTAELPGDVPGSEEGTGGEDVASVSDAAVVLDVPDVPGDQAASADVRDDATSADDGDGDGGTDAALATDPGAGPAGRPGGGSCRATPRATASASWVLVLALTVGLGRMRRRAGPRGPTCP
jgi:spore germination protein YaaH